MNGVLYLTDKFGVSSGYMRYFESVLAGAKLTRRDVTLAHIHSVVPGAIHKKGNQKAYTLNPDKYSAVKHALDAKIEVVDPKIIVTSCPAILGILTGMDPHANTIEKTRGGVYEYKGRKCVVLYPVSALHRISDKKGDEDGDAYNVKSGAWILVQDWRKVGRFVHDTSRKIPNFVYSVARTIEDAEAAYDFLRESVLISADIETKGGGAGARAKHFVSCDGYTGLHKDGKVRSFVIPYWDKFKPRCQYWETPEEYAAAIDIRRRINALPAIKVYQNGTYDNSYNIRDRAPAVNWLLDTIHIWHSMYPELPKSLDFISSIMLDNYQYWKADIKGIDDKDETSRDSNMERYWRYNALDCYNTLFNCLLLLPTLLGVEQNKFNFTHEFMLAVSGLSMSMKGIKADKDRLMEHELALMQEEEVNLKRLRYLADEPELNPQSPDQMKSLFYDVLGARPRDAGGKLVVAGSRKRPSVGSRALNLIKTEHPLYGVFVKAMHDAKQPRKKISSICRMGQNLQTGRFRYHLSAAGTETWRFSSKASNFWDGTNAQNITKKMRDWLIADEHHVLFDIDYSQSDFYFVAYESQDQGMIDLTQSNKDTHAVHAAHFFKKDYNWVVKGKKAEDPLVVHPETGIRNLSKRVVHGSNFRMMAMTLFITMGREAVIASGLALGLDCAGWADKQLIQICARLLASYRDLYPRLHEREWYGEINELLKKDKAIKNWFGMERKFMGDVDSDRTQREATAFYGQSGTAMNMNRVIYELDYGYMPKRYRDGLNPHADRKPIMLKDLGRTFFLLQVHDSFIGITDTRIPDWQQNINNILTVMERPITIHGREFYVPAEAEVMARWSKDAVAWNPNNPPSLDQIHAG